MKNKSSFLVAALVVASFLGSTGCFSYKKEVTETPAPASTTVVEPSSPVSTTESHSSTTTDPYGNTVQQQRSTTTTTTPGY